jgi:hypothetical protein
MRVDGSAGSRPTRLTDPFSEPPLDKKRTSGTASVAGFLIVGGGEDRGKERDAHRCYTEGQRQTFDLLFYVEPHECLHPYRVEIKLRR